MTLSKLDRPPKAPLSKAITLWVRASCGSSVHNSNWITRWLWGWKELMHMKNVAWCKRSVAGIVTVTSVLCSGISSAPERCLPHSWCSINICWINEIMHQHHIKQGLTIPSAEIPGLPSRILLLSPSRPCVWMYVLVLEGRPDLLRMGHSDD